MKTVAALGVTAVALAAGGFLLGYGTSEWWAPKPEVHVEGFVWEFNNQFEIRRDVYWERTSQSVAVDVEVRPFDKRYAAWRHEAMIRLSHYRMKLPARARRIGLEYLATEMAPRWTSILMYVEPDAPASRDRHGMINAPARYLISHGGDGYLFDAETEWEAERKAKGVVRRIFEEEFGGDVEAFAGSLPD